MPFLIIIFYRFNFQYYHRFYFILCCILFFAFSTFSGSNCWQLLIQSVLSLFEKNYSTDYYFFHLT